MTTRSAAIASSLRPNTPLQRVCAVWVTFVACCATSVFAAEGEVDLRRLAGPESALAIEVTGLPALYTGVRSSRWFEQVTESALVRRWRGSAGYSGFARTVVEVERQLGKSLPEVVEGLARNGLVFVLEPTREETVPGWILAGRGASDDRVAELVALWNRLERARTETRSADGFTWTERQVGNGSTAPLMYVVRGSNWWLSNREFLLRGGVTRSVENAARVADDAAFDWSREFDRLPKNAHVRCVVRTRAWDEMLKIPEGLQSTNHGDQFAARWWHGTDALSCSLGFDPAGAEQGPEVELRAAWREATPQWQAVCNSSEGGTSFLERVPANALLTLSGRMQPLAGWNWLPIPDDEQARKDMARLRAVVMGLCFGMDPFDDILAGLEANWGLTVVPLDTEVSGRWPVAVVALCELPGEGRADWDASRRALLSRGLANAVRTGLTVWSVALNEKREGRPTRLRAEPAREEGATPELVWLDGLDEGEPCYAVGPRYFAIGTSPVALRSVLDASAAQPVWQAKEAFPRDEAVRQNLLAHVSMKRLRTWLTDHKSSLATAIARSQKLDAQGVERRLERLYEGFELADDLILGARFDEREIVLHGAWTADSVD